MELTISGQPEFGIEGPVNIKLPEFMTLLPAEELKESITDGNRNLILAAGRHPSGDIVVLTGNGELRELKKGEYGIPEGAVTPTDHGQTLLVGGDGFEIASEWFVENASLLILFGGLPTGTGHRVSYVDYRDDETDAGKTPKADP